MVEINYPRLWEIIFLVIGALIGFILSYLNNKISYEKKEEIELSQHIYEPLRLELEHNNNAIWDADNGRNKATERQWHRINNEEYIGFRIKPDELREELGTFYTNLIHNYRNMANTAKETIKSTIIEDLQIKELTPEVNNYILHHMIANLITEERNMHGLEIYTRIFEKIKNDFKLEEKSYDEYRKRILKKLQNNEYMKHFWKEQKSLAKDCYNLIQQVNKKLKIKKKVKII